MPKNSIDKKKNSFYLRIYDDDLLTSVYELAETQQFSSMNDLLCQALAIGIEKIYLKFGKRKALSSTVEPVVSEMQKTDELLYRVKNMELTIDDIFVMLNIIEIMTTTLYNVEAAKTNNETEITAELMDSGYFSMLPGRYQDIKDKLISRIEKKKHKEKN